MERESWKSRIGFTLAAVGSAVGLINIWRFPYIVGQHGGGAFLFVYLLFLILIGFPVLVSEVVIGKAAKRGPVEALGNLAGRRPFWKRTGLGIVLTGFIVSSFYSVVAGWVLGYFVYATSGELFLVHSVTDAVELYHNSVGSPLWCTGFHILFMLLAMLVLNRGVRRGIEWGNKVMMPLLVVLLIGIMIRGLTLEGSSEALFFLFSPKWSELGVMGLLTALGHAFFTLSLGQGTMITYGSYLHKQDNIPRLCVPVVLCDTFVSLLAGIAVLSIVFASSQEAQGGIGLLFYALPKAFSLLPGGRLLAPLFFFLVLLAALTSQTSAMEPLISHLIDKKKWTRKKAVIVVGSSAFLFGIPSALSFSLLSGATLFGANFFEAISFLAMDLLIPIGGLFAILFLGRVWGTKKAFLHFYPPGENGRHWLLHPYLVVGIKWIAPILIICILISSLLNIAR